MRHLIVALTGLLLPVAAPASAQTPSATHRDSLPKVEYITVQKGVRLEVLDWGGTGRPLVLLAGLGNTAHVFDDLARKLNGKYHTIGVTRRGFGASSMPDSGYDADRLGDDVLAVLDALKLEKPVLVGHSIAGEELSSIGSRYPGRVSGFVYLDAAYSYAFYDPAIGDVTMDIATLRSKLESIENDGYSAAVVDELLGTDLPAVERELSYEKNVMASTAALALAPPDSPPDGSSFAALHAWAVHANGIAMPEAELRQQLTALPDGSVGGNRTAVENIRYASGAVSRGEQRYTRIPVPALALYAIPHDRGPRVPKGPALDKANEQDSIRVAQQAQAFARGVPTARVVFVPHANHYIFISNQSEVLREIDKFIATLP